MARITHSDLAPDEVVEYSFAAGSFTLGSGETYETDSRALLANARNHPWLKVEYDEVEMLGGVVRDTLANHPELDAMTQEGPNAGEAFDPEAIKKVEAEKAALDDSALAVDANLDQGEPVTVGTEETHEVDVTLAADEDHEGATDPSEFDTERADDDGMAPQKTDKPRKERN